MVGLPVVLRAPYFPVSLLQQAIPVTGIMLSLLQRRLCQAMLPSFILQAILGL